MRKLSDYSFILTFIWIGLILGISFIEAPVKFTAPSLTREAGLDVGKHVFQALNKVELAFATVTVLFAFFSKPRMRRIILLASIVIILILQSVWLLPMLAKRADIIIAGNTPAESSIHIIYIIIEIIKVILLFMFGWLQVKSLIRNYFLNI